jgi:hypothetical protein
MKPTPLAIAWTTLIVAVVVLVYGQFRQQTALNLLSARLETLETQHRRPDMRSAREAGAATSLRANSRSSSLGTPLSTNIPGEEHRSESPAERARKIASSKTTLDTNFSSEPINSGWAGKTMHTVEDAIVEVAAEGAPTPEGARVDCRSKTCRIQLNLADGAESDKFVMPLLTKFAKTLPVTQMIEVPSPDGKRFEVYIYASAADL